MARDLPRELERALLGDFVMLKRGSVEAQRFAQAFSTQAGQSWWEETEPDQPLGIAAKAVSAERRGEPDRALPLYEQVAGNTSAWIGLLGMLLQGWSAYTDRIEPVLDAADLVSGLRKSDRKARLLAKLSVFAADKGDIDTAHRLWMDAVEASKEKTQLGRALRIEAMNFGVGPPNYHLFSKPILRPDDPLVQPEAIEQLQLRSANGSLMQTVDDRLHGTWSHTVRMGLTPLDDLLSAEAQARWIGLPWMCRSIRHQFGAQLIAGGNLDADGWAQGVLMWTLGGGKDPHNALRYAEPYFNDESADYVVKSVGECDPSRNRGVRVASLGAEAWDLLSDATLKWLAMSMPPRLGQGTPAEESRRIWAAYAIRLTDDWYEQYLTLDNDLKSALFDSLQPSAVRHFSEEIRQTLYSALGDDKHLLNNGGTLLPFAAALAPPEDDERLRSALESEQPIFARVITHLIDERPTVVTTETEERFMTTLRDAVIKQAHDARNGTLALGGSGPRLELGRMLAAAKTTHRDLIELLIETATDEEMPPQYLLQARQALLLLRRKQKLSNRQLQRLRSAPEPRSHRALAEGISKGVLRIVLLQVLAEQTTASERNELVGAVRSNEVRVRDLAVNACAEALQGCQDDGLAWAVVSGMFDPSPEVSDGALAGLCPLTENHSAAAEVAWQRLPELLETSPRDTRAQIIHAMEHVDPKTQQQRDIRAALLIRARRDRSWRVRDAAAEASP